MPAGDHDLTRARARGSRAPAPAARRHVAAGRLDQRRASCRFGVTTVARGSSATSASRASGSSSGAPLSATITGSSTTGALGDEVERLAHRLDRLHRAEHADLDRVHPDVLGDRPDLPTIASGGIGVTPSTATVFCHVTAVIAVIPWTPQRANAFRSAWMPAPPPESEPAIESTRGVRVRALVCHGAVKHRARAGVTRCRT